MKPLSMIQSACLSALVALIGMTGMVALAQPAFAGASVDLLYSRFVLNEGEMTSLPLSYPAHIKKTYIQAIGLGCATTVEVSVNGDVKGTLYLPARDPSYVVTVAETTNSIEFRNLGPCRAMIQDVRAQFSRGSRPSPYAPAPTHEPSGSLSEAAQGTAAEIAAEAIDLVDVLREGATLSEQTVYLIPIKKVAARVYATANARGDLSSRTATQLQALKLQIDFAADYIDSTFERDTQFETATSLLGLRERIDALTE
jgi:hypothetical protein